MATIGTAVTLLDLAKSQAPDGTMAKLVNTLTQQNQMLEDMVWLPTNEESQHRTTLVTGLPTIYDRRYNQGVLSSKGLREQILEPTSMLEAYSKVDKRLLEKQANPEAWRQSEDMLFVEAMNQTMQERMLYGNRAIVPDHIDGFHTRFNSLTGSLADSMIGGGGVGSDNTSILIVRWGEMAVHGIYPKNTIAGLRHTDLGQDTAVDSNGGEYQILRSQFTWDYGLSIRDRRAVVRIPNIDVSNLVGESSNADLIKLIIRGLERIDDAPPGPTVIYCNKTVRTMLRIQITNKANVNLYWENFSGKKVMMFDDAPVRRLDRILNTEAAVS